MQVDGEPLNVDDLVAQLKRRVEERRREGLYPPDLDADLHEHQRRIAQFRSGPDFAPVLDALSHLDALSGFSPERIDTHSRVPGGKALHETVAKVVSRQTAGILEQVQLFADAMREALRAMLAVIEQPNHVHADLVGQLDAVFERIAAFERGPASSKAAVADLRQRVDELEVAEARRRFEPFYESARFEEAFRGSREELLDHYRGLAAELQECGPVVDIGCGRGEFLELLHELGVEASGVEIDPVLVEACRGRGLDVTDADGLEYLAGLDDAGLGGIVMVQVVEHLSPQQVIDFVLLARDKVRPGGRVAVETVNPQSLYVFAHAFYLDPTHNAPVHPAYLDFLFRQAGFDDVRIEWRSPPAPGDVAVADAAAPADSAFNVNVERLNRLLFAPQDYALIATR